MPGACGRLAGRGLALTLVLGVVTAMIGASAGIAAASSAPPRHLRPGGHTAAGSGRTLAQAPAGLRAAVRTALGSPKMSSSSGFQRARLTASDHARGDQFGYSAAISGSTAVVGAYAKNSSTGAAYVFVHSGTGWSQQAKLTAPDGAAGDQFGYSAAISGTTAVVGAPGKNSLTGAAFVFARSGTAWSQQAALTASDAARNDFFG